MSADKTLLVDSEQLSVSWRSHIPTASSHVITDEIADIVSNAIITCANYISKDSPLGRDAFVMSRTCYGCGKTLDGYVYRLTFRSPPYCGRLCFEDNH